MDVGELVIARAPTAHALFGEALEIRDRAGALLTCMTPIDLARPSEIPAIAEPARLPPGSGALLLNTIAQRASGPLRYAGPYPTPALYRSLLRSFRTTASEAEFTADVLGRAMRVARDVLPYEFVPAPHTRTVHAHGWSEHRDGAIERTIIDGTSFEPGAIARLAELRCELVFGDTVFARIATLAPDGTLADGPHAPPALAGAVLPFPVPLREALADLVADAVPAPLARFARDAVAQRSLAWADLGTRVARRTATGFEVHAALWQCVMPRGLARVALALAEALAPVVTAALVADLMPT